MRGRQEMGTERKGAARGAVRAAGFPLHTALLFQTRVSAGALSLTDKAKDSSSPAPWSGRSVSFGSLLNTCAQQGP